MRRRYILLAVILLILIVTPPLLAPLVHDNDSPKSAIRNSLYEKGHPYQSFFALITDKHIKDPEYGQKYDVLWKDWNSETGQTGNICYAKKNQSNEFKVTCGTGP